MSESLINDNVEKLSKYTYNFKRWFIFKRVIFSGIRRYVIHQKGTCVVVTWSQNGGDFSPIRLLFKRVSYLISYYILYYISLYYRNWKCRNVDTGF